MQGRSLIARFCNRENPGGMEGNSFSLSGVCDDRGQHAADTAAAREPCMEKIHVVGKISRPKDIHRPKDSSNNPATPAIREKAPSRPRLRRRRAGSRRRRETEGVALGRTATRQSNQPQGRCPPPPHFILTRYPIHTTKGALLEGAFVPKIVRCGAFFGCKPAVFLTVPPSTPQPSGTRTPGIRSGRARRPR